MKRRIVTIFAAALTLLLGVIWGGPAAALDDGGGRSVFARGAGERALALGGAYAAVADDPGAMLWNPAGLANLQRKSLYVSHSNLIGLGFAEQLGVVTLPSWRLGTFGIGVRRFGVDGIEGRDARGAVFDTDLRDSETQLLIGYGRTVGRVWRLGVVFKYQQQNLAGYSDGAPGVDVGAMVKPLQAAGRTSGLADALTVGIAIRNLIEPELKLDQDGVKDPTGLRLGVACATRPTAEIGLLLTTDVERTRDMDTRLHAGAELRLLDILALRAGTLAGMMTAGAGVRYHNLAVDYTFEDNPLAAVHRFGFGVAFGPTTDQTRQASLNTRQAELQQQLRAAYDRDNAVRLQTALDRARRDLAAGDYLAALGSIETIRVLEPSYAGLAELESAAYLGQGDTLLGQADLSGAAVAYQRCLAGDPDNVKAAKQLELVSARSNREAARTQVIRDRFEGALEAYARGDLVQARTGFASVLELAPADQEAAALLRNTEETLDLKAGLLVAQARAQLAADDLVAAKANLAKARILAPDHRALASVAAEVSEYERRQVAAAQKARLASRTPADRPAAPVVAKPVVAKPSFAALSAKDQADVAELYRRGLQAVEDHRNQDAIRYWELVWSRAPDYQQVAENLKQEYLAQGMEAFADGRLDRSIEIWEKAQTLDPADPRTRGYLARAYDHKARIRNLRSTP